MRIEQLPERGTVVIAHTLNESVARLAAEYEETDYLLHRYCPPDRIFVMNLDEFRKLFDASSPFDR